VNSVIENELPQSSPALALEVRDGKYHHFMQLASDLKRERVTIAIMKTIVFITSLIQIDVTVHVPPVTSVTKI
jgi:hypothetical protein